MDDLRFDVLIKTLGTQSRRRILLGLVAGALPGLASQLTTEATAKRHKTQKQDKPPKQSKSKRHKGNHGLKAQSTDKVTICHKPGTPAEMTLQVPQDAVSGHLGHGDYINANGCCSAGTPVCFDAAGNGACCPAPGHCSDAVCKPPACAEPDANCGNGVACCPGDGTTCCNGTCSHLNTTTNCGACGQSCAAGTDCCNCSGVPNATFQACPPGTDPFPICRDPRTVQFDSDPANCGSCQTVCNNASEQTGEECISGQCTRCSDRSPDLRYCRRPGETFGNCRNIMLDPQSCGACFHECATGQSCVGGSCV